MPRVLPKTDRPPRRKRGGRPGGKKASGPANATRRRIARRVRRDEPCIAEKQRKGFGTPAVKAKAIATRQRNAEIRRRLRKEAIARAKLEAKAIIAKLDAEKKARG